MSCNNNNNNNNCDSKGVTNTFQLHSLHENSYSCLPVSQKSFTVKEGSNGGETQQTAMCSPRLLWRSNCKSRGALKCGVWIVTTWLRHCGTQCNIALYCVPQCHNYVGCGNPNTSGCETHTASNCNDLTTSDAAFLTVTFVVVQPLVSRQLWQSNKIGCGDLTRYVVAFLNAAL